MLNLTLEDFGLCAVHVVTQFNCKRLKGCFLSNQMFAPPLSTVIFLFFFVVKIPKLWCMFKKRKGDNWRNIYSQILPRVFGFHSNKVIIGFV